MRNIKFSLYIRIFLVLALSFLFSRLLVKDVFLANTPKIRPHLDKYLAEKLRNTAEDIRTNFVALLPNFLKSKQEQDKQNAIALAEFLKKNLQPVASGVKANTVGSSSLIEYKINEVEWQEYTFNINGREVKIKAPKGSNPPPKELFENLK